MTTNQAKTVLLQLDHASADSHSMLDDGLSLLRRYPLAAAAVAGAVGIAFARSPWLRRASLRAAAGVITSRLL